MNADMLLNNLLEEFLLECVGNRLEEVSEVPRMLEDISYLENKDSDIARITECEILDVEDYSIQDFSVEGDRIKISYEISYILQAFANSEFIWRIQGTANCIFSIPGVEAYDWSIFQRIGGNVEQLLAHKDLLHFENISYSFMECDTI